jgi:hypothetical protein
MTVAINYKLYRKIKVKKKPWLMHQPGLSTINLNNQMD